MFRFQGPTTPAEISPKLKALIDELVPGGSPTYVAIKPTEQSALHQCVPTVEHQVMTFGGRALLGWSLWELPSLYIEAEFHCIWEDPSGSLVDVTPRQPEKQQVLFLQDPNLRYEGRQIDSIRRPIKQSALLLEFLATFQSHFEIMNRGERAFSHGEVVLNGQEAQEFNAIQRHQVECYLELQREFPIAEAYHPCPCGSGKKIKWCHKHHLAK